MHTFRGTIVEAFPINTFLTVLLCCFAAAYLALMAHRWWVDVLAAVLFVVAALTVESGLLVAVIIVGAALLGGRGVSRRGVVAIVLLLAGYFVLRFGVLHVGSPGLIERSSGYGFRILDPPELIERFGANPAGFYAYNIVTSALSVLFAEPRGGTFVLVRGLVTEAPYPPAIVNVIANTCATIFIAAYAVRRRDAWRSLQFDHNDRLVLLFFLVWAANSVISYPYTKDVIMSPAGAFFALAAFAAVSDAVSRIPSASAATALASIFLCAVLGLSWAIRFAAVPVSLTAAAGKVRNEWAYASEWAKRQSVDVDAEPAGALLKRLRDDAIYVYPPPPPVFEHWLLDAE